VRIGDEVALDEYSGLQPHLFEDRVMKVGGVAVADRAVIGSYAIVLYDVEVMKGETLPARTSWEGSPSYGATEVFLRVGVRRYRPPPFCSLARSSSFNATLSRGR